MTGAIRARAAKPLTLHSSRQNEVVGSLSGVWKMKLELARDMLYNADLLLLDEVCDLINI